MIVPKPSVLQKSCDVPFKCLYALDRICKPALKFLGKLVGTLKP